MSLAQLRPSLFYLLPVFNNPLFKTGRICLRNVGFGNSTHNIRLVADFYNSSGQIGTLADINTKFDTEISQFHLNRIHSALNSGRNLLNLNIGQCNWHQQPRQSALIQIAFTKLKGCRAFYNIFRAKANDKTTLAKCETKWHNLLTTNLSVTFWDRAWKLQASIKENNPFKWMQCQILRASIFTNNRVSKFKPDVTDQCDLCNLHTENALTLFMQCNVSLDLWASVRTYFQTLNTNVPTSRLQILFGVLDEKFDSTQNTIIMIGKRVIWASKHRKDKPKINHFKATLKDYLIVLKICKTITNLCNQFNDQWGNILLDLLGVQYVA